jgi:hypothetical protein
LAVDQIEGDGSDRLRSRRQRELRHGKQERQDRGQTNARQPKDAAGDSAGPIDTPLDDYEVTDRQAESGPVEREHLPAQTFHLPMEHKQREEDQCNDPPSGADSENRRPPDREHGAEYQEQLESPHRNRDLK